MTAGADELTCREVADFVAGYLADELGGQVRSLFEEHLAECPDCVAYLRSYADTIGATKDAYEVDAVEAGVPERLVRAILAARRKSR
jgi:predicted anti-sigma-YlaC factor YlaD